jgi:hypothetical protein
MKNTKVLSLKNFFFYCMTNVIFCNMITSSYQSKKPVPPSPLLTLRVNDIEQKLTAKANIYLKALSPSKLDGCNINSF